MFMRGGCFFSVNTNVLEAALHTLTHTDTEKERERLKI